MVKHCKYGHSEEAYINPRGDAECMKCRRMSKTKYNQQNKDKYLAQQRAWRKAHPEYARQNTARYKARIKAATVGKVSYSILLDKWDKLCGICKELVETQYEFDHIQPLSVGGPHSQANIQITHSICNKKKGAKYG